MRLYNLPESPAEPTDGMEALSKEALSKEALSKEALSKEALSKEALIAFCDVPRSRQEVADHFGVNVSYVAHAYLNPLADEGELVRTLPDRPRSKNQQFVARRRQK